MSPYSSPRSALPPAGFRVLLIDDNGQLVEALQDGLRLMGHEVQSSRRGTEVLRLANLLEPHVVVTDLIMPDVDILDVVQQLRDARPNTKIIAISGNPHLLSLAAKRGVDRTLAKPFGLKRLDQLIRAMVR